MIRWWFGRFFLPCLIFMAAGCGQETGDVFGKVTYQQKTVIYGSVTIVGKDGIPRQSKIGPDGEYAISGVPVGEVKIGVHSPNPNPALSAEENRELAEKLKQAGIQPTKTGLPPGVDPKKWFRIPDKYGDPANSGLTFTAGKGPNRHDLQLP